MTIPNYVTSAQVKAYMPTNEIATSTVWDNVLTTLCANCSRAWDKLTFREPGAYAVDADTTRYFDGVPVTATDYLDQILVGEICAVTSVSTAPNGGSFAPMNNADYLLWPYNAQLEGRPYTEVMLNPNGGISSWPSTKRSVQVVGKFGYSLTVPDDVLEALLLYVVRFIRKNQQNFLEVGTITDSGQVYIGMKVDPDLQDLVRMYRRGRV